MLAAGLQALRTMIGSIERRIIAQHRSDEASKRLRSMPGIGIVGATAIAATVMDPKVFRSGRDFAAWIGIVPRQESTGGKQKLGPISKRGDRYLRRILVVGACAVLRYARHKPEKISLAHKASRTQTVQGGRGGACQQDGAHRLGVVGQGRHLSGACACGRGVRSVAMGG